MFETELNENVLGKMVKTLSPYDWTHIGMLTTKNHHKPINLEGAFSKWIRRLENLNQKRVNHLFNIERTEAGTPHIHFLLGNVSDALSEKEMERHWGRGIADIEQYDRSEGGLFYTLKEFPTSEFKGIRKRGLKKWS